MFRESLFVVIVYYALCTNAANILFLNILPSRSHLFWWDFDFQSFCSNNQNKFLNLQSRNGAISNALAARGHNITMIAPEIDKHPPSGVHYIHSENLNDGYQKYNKEKFMQKVDTNPFSTALKTHFASIDICKSKCVAVSVKKFVKFKMESFHVFCHLHIRNTGIEWLPNFVQLFQWFQLWFGAVRFHNGTVSIAIFT